MLTEQRLREILGEVPGATMVDIGREGGKFIALVVSPDFGAMHEHERQAVVWRLLLAELSDAEQADVGYVFTNTEEERQEAQREASGA